MTQKVEIILEDDLGGGPAEETVRFGLDGKRYEMDLSAKNAAKLREAMRPFANKARKVYESSKSRAPRAKGSPTPNKETTYLIRRWAQENGYKVGDRGQVQQHIREAYHAAQKASYPQE